MYIHPAELKSSKGLPRTKSAPLWRSRATLCRGATLIEVLVAILLLSLAMTPALYGAVSALNTATAIRNNLIAANLAQEGVEVIRAIRDANWFVGAPFNAGLPDGSYEVQWDSLALLGNNNDLLLKSTGSVYVAGVYNYTAGTPTIFRRTITIVSLPPVLPRRLQIRSSVNWTERGRNRSIEIESYLYDWKN